MATNLASLFKRALLLKGWRAFARDERGVTAIEFGLLAVPFFSIIGAILETSVMFLSSQVLYSAVQDTGRLIRTGQMQSATIETFEADVCGRLYGLFDCSKLFVDVQVLTTFNAATIKAPVDFTCKTTAACEWNRAEIVTPGKASNIMVAQVYYRWPTVLNLGGLSLANLPTGERVLGAASVFKNEPF